MYLFKILGVKPNQVFDIPGVWYVDTVKVGESVGAWSGNLLDKVGPFPV